MASVAGVVETIQSLLGEIFFHSVAVVNPPFDLRVATLTEQSANAVSTGHSARTAIMIMVYRKPVFLRWILAYGTDSALFGKKAIIIVNSKLICTLKPLWFPVFAMTIFTLT
jgi:hypothetical protein